MIRPLRKKIYFAFFFWELKAIDLTFFRFYISWCFVKIKKWNKIQRPAEAILLSLPGLNEAFFFLSLVFWPVVWWSECIIQLGKHELLFSSLFGFRAMWVSASLGSVSAPSWKSGSTKCTTQPCLFDFAFSVENTGSDDCKGVCGRRWLPTL